MTTPSLNSTALKQQERVEQWTLLGLAIPAIFVILLVVIIPVGWLFYLSFIGDDGQFTLEHYQKMVEYKSYYRVFLNTFKVSILTTLICIVIGYPMAYFLAQLPARWAGFFMLAVLLPFWTSLLVRTYAWLVLLQRKGILNEFAMDIGLWEKPVKLVHNLTGTLIGMAHIMLPFLVLPLYNAMKKIDRDLMQAGANLGASPAKAFWQIYFPLSLPGMVGEQRRVDQTLDTIFDGEPVLLDADGHRFLSIFTESETRSNRGMIVLHGAGFHPDWHQVVKPVRVEITTPGCNTLSIQLPILEKSAAYEDYTPLYPQVPARMQAATTFLENRNLDTIVVVAHSQGVTMASYYLAYHKHDIKALVAIGMSAQHSQTSVNSAESLKMIEIPVLDIYGSSTICNVG